MNHQILYRSIIWLTALWLVAGCTKDLPSGDELPVGDEFTRIVFAPPGFTKADDLRAPTAGNEDGMQSLDVYGVAWNQDRIVNIFHAPGKDPTNSNFTWGEIKGDTAVIMSSLFILNQKNETVEYVNLYAIANIERLELAYPNVFKSFTDYNKDVNTVVGNYLQGNIKQIDPTLEDKLKNLVVKAKDLSTAIEYPVMANSMKVEGGASYLHMPLERIYCRIGFSFLFTGSSAEKIRINKITIDKTSKQGYLFLEENETGNPSLESLAWTADLHGSGWFKDANGTVYLNGQQPTGGGLLSLYADQTGTSQLYFRSCQYLCDKEEEAPAITLDITVNGSDGKTTKRQLKASLGGSGGVGGKKYYGFLRNHSYQVISVVNTSTLQLEGVTVEMHDWNDRPPVDIPEFK